MVLSILYICVPIKCIMTLERSILLNGLKRDKAEFVAKCSNFQQVYVGHHKIRCLTQIIDVATWKWEAINIDLVVGFPRTRKKNDSICFILYKLTNSAHFIPVKHIVSPKIMQQSILIRL